MTSTASNALVIANDHALANEYDKYKDDVNNSDDEVSYYFDSIEI